MSHQERSPSPRPRARGRRPGRTIVAALAALTLWASPPVGLADDNVVNVAGWGGPLQKLFMDAIGPELKKQTGASIVYTPGKAAETLAKVIAQRQSPTIDVVIATEIIGLKGEELNLWASLDPATVTNLKHVYGSARMPGDKGVLWSANMVGIIYNPNALERHGIKPPTSWKDLFDPRLKGKVVLGTIGTDFGLQSLLMLARIHGGDEKNIEPGFVAMRRLAASVVSFEKEYTRVGELFDAQTAWVGVWSHAGAAQLAKRGVPIRFVAPAEGVVLTGNFVGVVDKAPHAKAAQSFVNLLLGEPVLNAFAEKYASIPMNKEVKLSAEIRKTLPGEEAMSRVVSFDWRHINAHRDAWTERFGKEIETAVGR
ncbi:MAG: extracellular solute-binding protein [Phycisphaerales bacterium]|nr:extracellular solute-binding protein [Phycisphaerales bacterium]